MLDQTFPRQPVRALDVRTYEDGAGVVLMTARELEDADIFDFGLAD